ncbi:unnamed protein product [Scytosiphon promiscuus]
MPSIVSKIVAALGALGTLALLASVGHLFEEERSISNRVLSEATEADYKTRLLRKKPKVKEEPAAGIDFVPHVTTGLVQKTVFSSQMRMIFLVGLEGTGHHFMSAVLRKMCRLPGVFCPDVCPLAVALYKKMGTPQSPSDYREGLERIRNETEILALESDGLRNGTISLLAFFKCGSKAGMMSYPNYGGKDKPLQYVDLRILAEEAERAGIDLRLIYLSRAARSILLSDTQRRSFGGGFTHETRILTNNAEVIDSFSRELDPGFTTCFSYENISDPGQASRVGEFVAPTIAGAANFSRTLLQTVLVKTPAIRDDVDDPEGWDLMAERLQEKLDEIELSWC